MNFATSSLSHTPNGILRHHFYGNMEIKRGRDPFLHGRGTVSHGVGLRQSSYLSLEMFLTGSSTVITLPFGHRKEECLGPVTGILQEISNSFTVTVSKAKKVTLLQLQVFNE